VLVPFSDLTTPLHDVSFAVLDFETTGTGPETCAITEVGAARFRGGERVGTFQTLVNAGVPIPPSITYLTGITEAMVAPAPSIESVLPALVEFLGDAVIVGHNVRFDLAFLRANLARLGYPPPRNLDVDTLALARRLLAGDVTDCRLQTIARHLHTAVEPSHRALEDALATAEVFHRFLEDVGTLGVTDLDDLLALPRTAGHPDVAKLRWVGRLPRRPGVFLFRDLHGDVLHVGHGADLRAAVRALFVGRDRRTIGPMLRVAHSLEHVVCETALEAAVRDLRLARQHRPRFDLRTKAWGRRRYLRVDGPTARIATPRTAIALRPDERIGPFADVATARAAADLLDAADAHDPPSPASLALGRARARRGRIDGLVARGRILVEVDGDPVVIERGRLVVVHDDGDDGAGGGAVRPADVELAEDEADLLARWLTDRRAPDTADAPPAVA
jgi:DNA polymerase-3 subunit epsilon